MYFERFQINFQIDKQKKLLLNVECVFQTYDCKLLYRRRRHEHVFCKIKIFNLFCVKLNRTNF